MGCISLSSLLGTHVRCWRFGTCPSTYTSAHFRTELGAESDWGGKEEEVRGQKEDEIETAKPFKVPSLKDIMAPDNHKD